MTEEKIVDVYIPALVALLTRAETIAERPLTESEVIRIRDSASVVKQPLSAMPKFINQRGYHDIYAPDAWAEWQAYR